MFLSIILYFANNFRWVPLNNITKEVEKRSPKKYGCVLPNYRIKADAEVIDEFVNKLAEYKAVLFPEFDLKKGAILEVVLKKLREQKRQQKETASPGYPR